MLGYGAVKYADLKSNRNSNYIFDYDRMLDPRGNTAVYMLYTGARLCSILRKAGAEIGSAPAQALLAQTTLTLDHPAELAVASVLIRFQEGLTLTRTRTLILTLTLAGTRTLIITLTLTQTLTRHVTLLADVMTFRGEVL